ncbi:MAG: hypothetical protein CMF72_09875 [Mameliella sp.]|nr:hypothetical protein [Mameliella sp.]
MLFQYPNDLFFAKTASLHLLSPQLENRLTQNTGLFRGAGHFRYWCIWIPSACSWGTVGKFLS